MSRHAPRSPSFLVLAALATWLLGCGAEVAQPPIEERSEALGDCGDTECTVGPSRPGLYPPACSGHGELRFGRCFCSPGYTGRDCSVAVAPGCPLACSRHGQCLFGTCFCEPGYSGFDCGTVVPSCPGDCSAHGQCVHGTCFCEPGRTGLDCGTVEESCPGDCSGHGQCRQGVCYCEPGRTGRDCSVVTEVPLAAAAGTEPVALAVSRIDARVTVSNASAIYRTRALLRARLESGTYSTFGRTVTFYVDRKLAGAAVTDQAGNAQLDYLLPATVDAGSSTITASVSLPIVMDTLDRAPRAIEVKGTGALLVVKAPVRFSSYIDYVGNPDTAPASGYKVSVIARILSDTTPSWGVGGQVDITFGGVTKSQKVVVCDPTESCTLSVHTDFTVGPADFGKTLRAHIAFAGDQDHLPGAADTSPIFLRTPFAAVPVYRIQLWGNGNEWASGDDGIELTQARDIVVKVEDQNRQGVAGVRVWAKGTNWSVGSQDHGKIDFGDSPGVTDADGRAIIPFSYLDPKQPGEFRLDGGIVYNGQRFQASQYDFQDSLWIAHTVIAGAFESAPTLPGQEVLVGLRLTVPVTQLGLPASYVVWDGENQQVCSGHTDGLGLGSCYVRVPADAAAGPRPFKLGVVQPCPSIVPSTLPFTILVR